jgi:hypothetical protein
VTLAPQEISKMKRRILSDFTLLISVQNSVFFSFRTFIDTVELLILVTLFRDNNEFDSSYDNCDPHASGS